MKIFQDINYASDVNSNILDSSVKLMSTPLEYKTINIQTTNILLIDNDVYQNEILYDSVNLDTLAIKYNNNSSKNELHKLLLNNFIKIDRIGFVFNDSMINSKEFMDSEMFFNSDDLILNQKEYSPSLKFIIDLIKKFNITNVDFLVCNGLTYPNWVKYFDILHKETGVIIGVSNDETGNIKYGGDWVLESTNEDIKNIYWTNNIDNYSSTLATSTISTSLTLTNADLNNSSLYTWPITINGGTSSNPVVITFGDDISLNLTSKYFIIGSAYITIDGSNFEVKINDVSSWNGLLKNGTSSSIGYSNIQISNININIYGTSTIASTCGLVCYPYFGYNSFNILISNCHSSSEIGPNSQCGLICGRGFCQGNGRINSSSGKITNCYSTGNITSMYGGGIVGNRTAQNSGLVNITNCYSTGNIIEVTSGGICGSQAGRNYGSVNITNCYSTGVISSNYGGGIVGDFFGYNTNNLCKISGCYSTGNITGLNAGGIAGAEIGYNDNISFTPNILIENSYVLGDTSGFNSGSICGGSEGYTYTNTSNVNIVNCYALYGPTISSTLEITPTQTNVHTESITHIWSDSNAKNVLTGTPTYDVSGSLVNPIGSVWADIDSNSNSTPWLFATFGYSPYTTELTTTFSQTLGKFQQSSSPALNPIGHTYSIVSINNLVPNLFPSISIVSNDNTSGGTINIDKYTPTGVYNIKVMQNSNYSITNFNLTFVSYCFNKGTKILCFKDGEEQYIKIEDLKKGDLVKTLNDGYIHVNAIGTNQMQNNPSSSKGSMYKYGDLIVTGCHILLTNWEKKYKNNYVRNSKVDNKYRLMACDDQRFTKITNNEIYTIYNIVLDGGRQYGIWAEGILTESAKKRSILNGYLEKI